MLQRARGVLQKSPQNVFLKTRHFRKILSAVENALTENHHTHLNQESVILDIDVWEVYCLQKETYGLCAIRLRTMYLAWLFTLLLQLIALKDVGRY